MEVYGIFIHYLIVKKEIVNSISFWCLDAESNHGHGDFQSPALPTELSRLIIKNGDPDRARTDDL